MKIERYLFVQFSAKYFYKQKYALLKYIFIHETTPLIPWIVEVLFPKCEIYQLGTRVY